MSDEPQDKIKRVAFGWWRDLHSNNGRMRAYCAQLRRAGTVNEALMHPYTHELYRRMLDKANHDFQNRPETLGALAMILAHVKEGGGTSLPRLMGWQGEAGTRVSGTRFERIVRAQTVSDLAPLLRRVLPLVKHRCDVNSLVIDLVYWTERTRQNWCFEYYNAIPLDAKEQLEEGQNA